MNSFLLVSRGLAAAILIASVACSNDSSLTSPGAAVAARGSSNTPPTTVPTVSVGGSWTTLLPPSVNTTDSTRWSLFLTQKGEKLEGGLTQIAYVNGQTFVGVSAIKTGSISGQLITLEFDKGEGAETRTIFSGTVSDDRQSITGSHSRVQTLLTFTRR